MKLSVLPDVLQDLVLEFAFNLPKHDVLESLDCATTRLPGERDKHLEHRVDRIPCIICIPSHH